MSSIRTLINVLALLTKLVPTEAVVAGFELRVLNLIGELDRLGRGITARKQPCRPDDDKY